MLAYPPAELPYPPPETVKALEWSRLLQREMNARLNLAYQGLTEVPEKVLRKYSNRLRELDLTHNNVREFRFLLDVPNLESLILDHNGITSHVKFPTLPKLHTLWINHNNITNLVLIIKQLRQCFPNLQYLSMMNNEAAPSFFNGGTFEQYKDYRYYVISQLPYLQMLDDTTVSFEEREEAERIYTRMSVQPPQTTKTPRRTSKSSPGPALTPQQIHASLLESLPSMEQLSARDYTMENALDGDSDEEPIDVRKFQGNRGSEGHTENGINGRMENGNGRMDDGRMYDGRMDDGNGRVDDGNGRMENGNGRIDDGNGGMENRNGMDKMESKRNEKRSGKKSKKGSARKKDRTKTVEPGTKALLNGQATNGHGHVFENGQSPPPPPPQPQQQQQQQPHFLSNGNQNKPHQKEPAKYNPKNSNNSSSSIETQSTSNASDGLNDDIDDQPDPRPLTRDPIMDSLPDLAELDIYSQVSTRSTPSGAGDSWSDTDN